MCDEDELHFYALYLLGEFEDREFFPKIMQLAALPSEILDILIGDIITTGLKDIAYHTYNGDLKLLKNVVVNEEVDEYVRAGLLEVMGQLYQDGTLEEQEWKSFIKECVYSGEEFSYFYNGLGRVICRCHFEDMLPEIRYMVEQKLIDEYDVGEYSAYVDYMFEYREYEKRFCVSALDTADTLRGWAMFEQEDDPLKSKKRTEAHKKLMQGARKERMQEIFKPRISNVPG